MLSIHLLFNPTFSSLVTKLVNTKFGIELILCQPPHDGGGAGVLF